MKHTNLISAVQSTGAFDKMSTTPDKNIDNNIGLSKAEISTLAEFYETLKKHNLSFEILDGYYIGYSIKQISKEFDLLRFGDDSVINIELKSPLDENVKIKKITEQMQKNYYYLKFLGKEVYIYTYIENDGLYKYDNIKKQSIPVEFNNLISVLLNQTVNDEINPNNLFVPNNYLVSPFNSTDKFVKQEYFLTDRQQEIKNEILKLLSTDKCEFFCISANAGTGKTLLVYDIAKTISNLHGSKSALIIHCGKLNEGHVRLTDIYKWNIHSISVINSVSVNKIINEDTRIILLDEAQRIRKKQLNMIIDKAINDKIKIIFSYDPKQYLSKNETLDLYDYVTKNYQGVNALSRNLTNKIRTNKEISSFITNLMAVGKSNSDLNYEDITIDYFDSFKDARQYVAYLENEKGWKAITFTNSRFNTEPIDNIARICKTKAHDVIGQEFRKVALVMDKNFKYGEDNRLLAQKNYYSVKGMLYQIVTRVTNELKIIVLDNPDLYCKLLEIKSMSKR